MNLGPVQPFEFCGTQTDNDSEDEADNPNNEARGDQWAIPPGPANDRTFNAVDHGSPEGYGEDFAKLVHSVAA